MNPEKVAILNKVLIALVLLNILIFTYGIMFVEKIKINAFLLKMGMPYLSFGIAFLVIPWSYFKLKEKTNFIKKMWYSSCLLGGIGYSAVIVQVVWNNA